MTLSAETLEILSEAAERYQARNPLWIESKRIRRAVDEARAEIKRLERKDPKDVRERALEEARETYAKERAI